MKRELLIEPLSGQPMLLPAAIDPVPLVEAEAKAREEADTALQGAIDDEVKARADADAGKVDKTATGANTAMSIGYGDTEVILSDVNMSDNYRAQLKMTPGEIDLSTFDEHDELVTNLNVNKSSDILLSSGDTKLKVDGDGAYLNDEAISTAADLSEHNTSEEAHTDIRQAVAANTTLIRAIQGVGGYLTAYDFGTDTPTQEDLTGYALEQIGITDPLDIFNGTRIKNTFDNHVWILANTPGTDPPVFEWIDDGEDVVDVPNTEIADISADADDTVVTSGTLVNLLKSLSGRIKALLARFHATTGHVHNGTDSPKVAYSDITGTPAIPAAQVNADWNATAGVAQILNKPNIQPTTPEYTFIVDSDEALAAWANNAVGNDYSHVFIKKGTWTSNKEVNLTNAGTKVVVGQAGSLLAFSSQWGFSYNIRPTTTDYWMFGVNVSSANLSLTYSNCFNRCFNLTNCTGSSKSNGNAYAFLDCVLLTNCCGTGEAPDYCAGFYTCKRLLNCIGGGIGTGTKWGYYTCKVMIMCWVSGSYSTPYNNCYMKESGTDYPVANTAEGGWNAS